VNMSQAACVFARERRLVCVAVFSNSSATQKTCFAFACGMPSGQNLHIASRDSGVNLRVSCLALTLEQRINGKSFEIV